MGQQTNGLEVKACHAKKSGTYLLNTPLGNIIFAWGNTVHLLVDDAIQNIRIPIELKATAHNSNIPPLRNDGITITKPCALWVPLLNPLGIGAQDAQPLSAEKYEEIIDYLHGHSHCVGEIEEIEERILPQLPREVISQINIHEQES